MTKTRTVTVKWTDSELEIHILEMMVPARYNRKDIDAAVDTELFNRGVSDYRWYVHDDITQVLTNKIMDFLETSNLRFRVFWYDDSAFTFDLTDYDHPYINFKVDCIEFTLSQSHLTGVHVTEQEVKNARKVYVALRKILNEVQTKIKE